MKTISLLMAFSCLAPFTLGSQLVAAPIAVKLLPGVPILLPTGAPQSVRLAVDDLRRDLEKVLGQSSPIIANSNELRGRPGIVILLDGSSQPAWHNESVSGRESHGIHVREIDGQNCVVLEGTDPRGTIFAIYSFSDEFLDVPPLWYWASWVPGRKSDVEIPATTNRIFPPAYVRWRAWFNNDTDLLSPWRARSPENNQAVYETLLRLKYNTYEVESIADLRPNAPRFAAIPDAADAAARGLAITHHHRTPLGSNLADWSAFWKREGREPPPLRLSESESLATFWRYHVETGHRAGFEQVWTLAFRGNGDIPFWETFKDAPTEPAARAHVIGEMLQKQVEIVKSVTGDPAPAMRTIFYNEGSTLFAAGLLHPPTDPTLIWNFVAARRDHFPADDVRRFKAPAQRLIGYYLNFQFTSTGSHLAPAEGPWKMASNYRFVDAIGTSPLAFTVVNAGNIREHLTELSANAAMMWQFKEFSPDAFLRTFCARYFSRTQAEPLAELYREYYQAYWNQKPSDIPGFERQYIFQDMRYARAVEMLLKDLEAGVTRVTPLEGNPLDNSNTGSTGYFRVEPKPDDAGQIGALLRGTAESGQKFAAVAAHADSIALPTEASRRFFNDNLRARARLMVALNALLHETALAYQARSEQREAQPHLVAAIAAADAARASLESTAQAPFEQWYANDHLFGLASLRARLKTVLDRTP